MRRYSSAGESRLEAYRNAIRTAAASVPAPQLTANFRNSRRPGASYAQAKEVAEQQLVPGFAREVIGLLAEDHDWRRGLRWSAQQNAAPDK